MPLLKPEIQKILRASGIGKGPGGTGTGTGEQEEKTPLTELMESAGLGLREVIENLANATQSSNEAIRVKANDTALKLHGVLKDTSQQTTMPSFTIIINDKFDQAPADNPIFLPRQLHNELKAN